jgi:hypothetical protein
LEIIALEIFTILGVAWAVWMVLKMIASQAVTAQERERIKEQVAERIRVVELEKIEESGNVLLAYDQENNRFLGQATDVEGIKQTLMSRFPDQIFILNGEPFSALPALEKK